MLGVIVRSSLRIIVHLLSLYDPNELKIVIQDWFFLASPDRTCQCLHHKKALLWQVIVVWFYWQFDDTSQCMLNTFLNLFWLLILGIRLIVKSLLWCLWLTFHTCSQRLCLHFTFSFTWIYISTKNFFFWRFSNHSSCCLFMQLFYLSGILTVFFCGIVMSHYTWHNVTESSRITTKYVSFHINPGFRKTLFFFFSLRTQIIWMTVCFHWF